MVVVRGANTVQCKDVAAATPRGPNAFSLRMAALVPAVQYGARLGSYKSPDVTEQSDEPLHFC